MYIGKHVIESKISIFTLGARYHSNTSASEHIDVGLTPRVSNQTDCGNWAKQGNHNPFPLVETILSKTRVENPNYTAVSRRHALPSGH
jgi:hypothetical protein